MLLKVIQQLKIHALRNVKQTFYKVDKSLVKKQILNASGNECVQREGRELLELLELLQN